MYNMPLSKEEIKALCAEKHILNNSGLKGSAQTEAYVKCLAETQKAQEGWSIFRF
jgi:hypothetical protein